MVIPLISGMNGTRGRMCLTTVDQLASAFTYYHGDNIGFSCFILNFNSVNGSFDYGLDYANPVNYTPAIYGILYR